MRGAGEARAVGPGRSWRDITAALSCCLLLWATPAFAQDMRSPLLTGDDEGGVDFDLAVNELSADDIQVYNGISPAKGDWRAILVASLPPPGPGSADARDGTCTAVLVGRNVFLTAAHCVHRRPGKTPDPVRLRIGSSWDLKFACSVDPVYAGAAHIPAKTRHEADYALCAIDPLAQRPDILDQIVPETIDLDEASSGEDLLAAGYGCIDWTIDSTTGKVIYGEVRRTLTIGDVTVAEAAAGADTFTSRADATRQSALCVGDSGGPAFRGPSVARLTAPRRIVGLASLVIPGPSMIRSRFTSLGSTRFKTFLTCWLYRNPNSGLQLKQPGKVAPVVAKPC